MQVDIGLENDAESGELLKLTPTPTPETFRMPAPVIYTDGSKVTILK